jgi:hypothetical protein
MAEIELFSTGYEYLGAEVQVRVVFDSVPRTLCAEGTLAFHGVKLALDRTCVVYGGEGDTHSLSLARDITVNILGSRKPVARASVTISVRVVGGTPRLASWQINLCGSNTRELKCRTWEWAASDPTTPPPSPPPIVPPNVPDPAPTMIATAPDELISSGAWQVEFVGGLSYLHVNFDGAHTIITGAPSKVALAIAKLSSSLVSISVNDRSLFDPGSPTEHYQATFRDVVFS